MLLLLSTRRFARLIRWSCALLTQTGLVPCKSRFHQFEIKTRVSPLKFCYCNGEFHQAARRGRFQDAYGAGDKKSAPTSGVAPGAVVHQHGSRINLFSQANRLQFARIDSERRIEGCRRLNLDPER